MRVKRLTALRDEASGTDRVRKKTNTEYSEGANGCL